MARNTLIGFSKVLLFVFAVSGLFRSAPASAQAQTTLAVDPAQVNIPLGNALILKLLVSDGVDVNGFSIRLTYSQQQLSLRSWAHGGYLSALSCVNEVKTPGLLELDCAQSGQDDVTGDGTLLELTFDTLGLGTADITLVEAIFEDSDEQQTQPERGNGVVNVQNLPTYTPTPTRTATTSLTTTPTLTVTPTGLPTQATSTPLPVTPSATGLSSLTPTTTPAVPQETPTYAGTPSKTLITPVSGVAGPSRRSSTPTPLVLQTATPEVQTTATVLAEAIGSAAPDGEDDLKLTADPAHAEEHGLAGISSTVWDRILLIVLIASLTALVVMVVIIIRRKAKRDEDLLI